MKEPEEQVVLSAVLPLQALEVPPERVLPMPFAPWGQPQLNKSDWDECQPE